MNCLRTSPPFLLTPRNRAHFFACRVLVTIAVVAQGRQRIGGAVASWFDNLAPIGVVGNCEVGEQAGQGSVDGSFHRRLQRALGDLVAAGLEGTGALFKMPPTMVCTRPSSVDRRVSIARRASAPSAVVWVLGLAPRVSLAIFPSTAGEGVLRAPPPPDTPAARRQAGCRRRRLRFVPHGFLPRSSTRLAPTPAPHRCGRVGACRRSAARSAEASCLRRAAA